VELADSFVVQPVGHLWFRYDWTAVGAPVADGFKYTSDNNTEWLDDAQIQALVAPFEAAFRRTE